MYEDYGAMDQKRIAIMRDSYQNQMTSKISENHGIMLIEALFDSDREVVEALKIKWWIFWLAWYMRRD